MEEGKTMNKGFPMASLRELLIPVSRPESVDPEEEYRILGAHWYAKGLYTKDIKRGSEIQANKVYQVAKGDFVYNRLFDWKGSFAIASKENYGCYVSNEFPCFKVNQERIDVQYLWHYFSRATVWEDALGLSTGGTPTSRNRLKEEKLLAMQISLPPLSEQRRIVVRIDELTPKIEEARRLRQQTTEAANVLFKSVRAKCLHYAQNKHGGELLGSLISMSSGEGLTSNQLDDSLEYPVYGGGGFVGRYSRYLFEESKIVIGRVGARCGCVFVTKPKSWITDNALYLTKISERLDKKYLAHTLSNVDLRQQANQAAQPVISQKKINPIIVPVPPLSEQRRIVAYLDNLQAKVNELKRLQVETEAELDALLPSILDKAFKGEL